LIAPLCRFENRLTGQALAFDNYLYRIEAATAGEVDGALQAIEAARRAGHWVALLLDYELGEWLAPELAADAASAAAIAVDPLPGRPRLLALVFGGARRENPWSPANEQGARIDSMLPRMARSSYVQTIESVREAIANGEFYQLNYTLRLDVRMHGTARDLYTRIAHRNPVAHAAYIDDGTQTVLSFSPELFVAREGSTLITRPMKGTAPRDDDPARDAQLGQELAASSKNRAENLMIVDLLRNDLGRVATTGSVRVDALFTLERYPTVWTMTSTLSAQAPLASLADVLRALFPCGSVTGAPKIAAMRRIRQLETTPRGLYCGSIGWLAPNGDFSLNVAIRTLVIDADGNGVYGTGGGIVHDSEAESEWQECLWKARILQY
jgi:para-aminobenzoate synthetase component 1